jgi:conjugal transfer/entry exclusion protein
VNKKAVNTDINFIIDRPSTTGKILQWLAIYGIFFVIATTVVIIVSTGINTALNFQVTKLDKDIAVQLQKISEYDQFSKEFAVVQDQLDQYQTTLGQERMEDLFPKLTTITPPGVTMEEMVIVPTNVVITGTALTQNDLANFVQNIWLIEKEVFDDGQKVQFANLSVEQIKNLGGNQLGFEFSITFDYKFT